MWEAIRYFAQKGCKSFCLGRTEPENKGLLQFKRGWGTKERTIRYYRYDMVKKTFVQNNSRLKGLHNAVFMRMPIPLLKITGELLYKHMG
jgi:lipid II:glycine glycyltransferase (peptidoglycan interpeptide bridge formation enzyme)